MKAILIVALIAIATAGFIGYRATDNSVANNGCPPNTHIIANGACVEGR